MLIVMIHNDDTGTPITGNYDYTVRINDYVIATGHIDGHDRREGAAKLIGMVAEDMSGEPPRIRGV